MSGHIVYQDVPRTRDDDDQPHSNLFAGQRLWFSHVIPQRQRMIQNARLNGAVIVNRDTDADVRLVDHLKKNNAPGTYSYRYVELSLRNGRLENLADHAVGAPSRVSRPVGSTLTAPKSGRTPFTPEDDRFLWDWMKPFIDRGGAWKGNEIYKQMEEANPRHTFQSWRDRWIKHTQFQKSDVSIAVVSGELRAATPATPSSHSLQKKKRRRELHDDGEAQRAEHEGEQNRSTTARVDGITDRTPSKIAVPHEEASRTISPAGENPKHLGVMQNDGEQAQSSREAQSAPYGSFTKKEYDELYELAALYVGGEFNDFDAPWEEVAEHRGGTRTPAQWKHFYVSRVIPDYCKNNKLPVSEVAPYLSREADEQIAGASEMLDSQEGDRSISHTAETQEDYQCTNCFTVETVKWRHDEGGKLICYECAEFVRQYGHHRPSATWSTEENNLNTDENEQSRTNARSPHVIAARKDSVAQIMLTPDSSLASRARQKPLFTPECSVGSSRPVRGDDSQQSPRLASPSLQMQRPALNRPPEPNESRKRRAGRGTPSESTQESNRSGTQSQTLDYSLEGENQIQTAPSQGLTAEMGEAQSKEGDAQMRHSTQAEKYTATKTASAFPAPPKDEQKQQQDGPGGRNVPPHPSIGSENLVHGQAHTLASKDSKEDDQLSRLTTLSNPRKPSRSYRDDLPLFVPEHDVEEEQQQNNGPELGVDADLSGLNPPNNPQASENFETAPESIQEYETGPEEQPQSSDGVIASQVLIDRLKDINDELDLAFEVPEPPGGLEAIGIDLSVMPNDEDIGTETTMFREEGQPDQSPDSLEVQVKIEDQSLLRPPLVLFGSVDVELGSSPGAEDMSGPSENVKGKGKEVEERTIEQGQREASSAELDGHETDDWLALQRDLHPHVPNLEPVLFKAIEATSFDFGLASEVVDIMLESRRQATNEPRRQSRSNGVGRSPVPAEADLDMEGLLPKAMRGVWTETDDSLLLSPNESDVKKVLTKHGRDICDARFVFLEEFVEG
ncbi:uncharacterized protein Z519_02976 [Cladophialophora bantiana CBS 173.52]|uniref:DNA-binding protein RAP1 n=1 Tax=Cladophialophora bantiana (strain ATCC 10958 / CBS 173.52 / CDC B-1940 / NIH 8579) TaxID=1442370 RepID=A0A0D2HY94_CLAB1|nr:uncharacterized protein Z519_02976 [Cladophialophora bantiana CBS 173.52]KIW95910.1 hypothetical protein Z519_02976 [Cladophialophora bantiana CBS 173.52]